MTEPADLTTPIRTPEDADAALRPKTLAEFVGQAAARENLRIFIEAAKTRADALDHVLFYGPPGLGKTTLAQIVARELGVGFRSTSGPVIAKAGDLAALLTNLELEQVITRAARLLALPLSSDGALEIAKRSRGTPRIAGRLLRRVRDFATVAGHKIVDAKAADAALNRLEVDALGLDAMDRRYLTMIADIYRGGPVGVETMAAGLSEPRDTIEDVIEPYLLQVGLIARTARGRMLNASAWKHLGLNPPAGSQDGLFDQGK